LPKCSLQAHRLVRVQIDEPPRSKNRCGKQNGELPLLCHFTVLYVRGSISRLPACPDLMPVVATGVRVGVRVTRRNRQHVDGWNTRVWGLGNSVDKKIVEFGHFITVGALYFDLAARIVVVASGRELATSLMILNQRAEPNTGFPSRARRRQTTPRFDHPKPCSCLYGERVALLHLVRGEHP